MKKKVLWWEALYLMFLANVVSTVPGVIVAICAGSLSGIIFAVPLVYLLGRFVGKRLSPFLKERHKPWASGGGLALAFTGFFYFSVFIHIFAEEALSGRRYGEYWVIKFVFVTLVASTGILISSSLEESVIGRLTRTSQPNALFYRSVVRANYVTLALVLLVAAIQILPKRLNAPHFLVTYVKALFTTLGLF